MYHYTIGERLVSILKDGLIKPATAFVPKNERPVVWFSRANRWERTANKMTLTPTGYRTLTMEETAARGGGLYRIAVSSGLRGLHPFTRIVRESGQHPAMTRALLTTAHEVGSDPEADWYGTFHPVPVSVFLCIEICLPTGWEPTSWEPTKETT